MYEIRNNMHIRLLIIPLYPLYYEISSYFELICEKNIRKILRLFDASDVMLCIDKSIGIPRSIVFCFSMPLNDKENWYKVILTARNCWTKHFTGDGFVNM